MLKPIALAAVLAALPFAAAAQSQLQLSASSVLDRAGIEHDANEITPIMATRILALRNDDSVDNFEFLLEQIVKEELGTEDDDG